MLNMILFAEDPGAVNYIAPIVEELLRQGSPILLLSAGAAIELFRKKGISSYAVKNEEEAVTILKRESPELLIVGTSENIDSPGFALISAAKKMQITSIGVVDFYANAAYRFRGRTSNALAFAPDWLIVSDECTAKEYELLGFAKKRIFVAGHPHFDSLIKLKQKFDHEGHNVLRAKLFPEVPENQMILVFVSEISTGLNPEQYQFSDDYTLSGRGKSIERTEIVVEELLDTLDILRKEGVNQPYLVLRRHPKEAIDSLSNYLDGFNLVSNDGEPLELIYVADVVVGMSSMLLSEACLLGKQVLSILPREVERDWLVLTNSSTIFCATKRDEIYSYLRELLCNNRIDINKSKSVLSLNTTTNILRFLQTATRTNVDRV